MSLAERIKLRRHKFNLKQRGLAKKAGISFGGIQKYEGGKIPKGDNLLKLSRALECSMDWLMTGEYFYGHPSEEDLYGESHEGNIIYLEANKEEKIAGPMPNVDSKTVTAIPKIESTLEPGSDLFKAGEQPIGHRFFRKDWLNSIGSTKGLFMVDVVGDGMKPTLEEGDYVMIDTNRTTITGAKIYAIREGDSILIKRLQPMVGGKLQIISDNSTLYPPQELDLSKNPLNVIGQIVYIGKTLVMENP